MATQYNSNQRSVSLVLYTPFNYLTGVESTIDDVIAATEGQCRYVGGDLFVAGRPLKNLDKVGVYLDTEEPVALTPAELAAGWTVD